jgi:hypothetical protein
MPKLTPLDKQWAHLMSLCANETRFLEERQHPRLLRLVQHDIEALAREMGFSAAAISTRDFRAERDGNRILRIIAG